MGHWEAGKTTSFLYLQRPSSSLVISLFYFIKPGNPPFLAHAVMSILGWGEHIKSLALEKGMATPSIIPAWRIPWTEEPGGLWSIGLQRVGHD